VDLAHTRLSRVGIVIVVLASTLVALDHPNASADTVAIDITVEGACESTAGAPFFAPALASGIVDPMSSASLSQMAYVDLYITSGTTSECSDIDAYVTFTESGFGENIQSSFDCDNSPLADMDGVFTCSNWGIGGSPSSVGIEVSVLDGAIPGEYTNTLTFTLVPEI
jgi:hypothetical protein